MKAQYGKLITGDLEENTMTFQFDDYMVLQKGEYAIVPIEEYRILLQSKTKNHETN